ncbi:MAG TPA: glycosyltransferase family 2 protein [Mucilaginibacter sp.]|nr:glycosyltransferase family 2 protein [Mucilaginibacter sp.]
MAAIALVTVLFNSDSVLEGFFKSLSIQTFTDFHLYLVDNTPNPHTDDLLLQLSKTFNINNYTHIKNDSNVGIAKGNNQGVELSLRENCLYTLLLNNDIEFYQADLLKDMYLHASKYNEALIIPKILYYGTNKIWMAGGRLFKYSGKTIHIRDLEDDDPGHDKPSYFEYAPTCFMLIDNHLFRKIGMMDENYFVYYDDTDFIYRAVIAGYKVYYMPNLQVMHKVSTSTGGGSSLFTIYYTNRNRIYFLRKNFKGIKKLLPLAVTLTTRVGKSFLYNRRQTESMWKAVVRGFKMKIDSNG